MSSARKRAFTLTELLVVVIVIGVLAAVTLPKFSKVLETRKTTEAEELMSAVRTEQEKRCSLDKAYVSNVSKLAEILPSKETKNFSYALTSTGMKASSKGKYGYQLEMPSYADGRVCCANAAECARLNKDYPLCDDLMARADYKSGGECAEAAVSKTCAGDSVQSCGCLGRGTKTRTCNESTGNWGGWGACSMADSCDCSVISGARPADTTSTCNGCGTRTTSAVCNAANGQWQTTQTICSKTAAECECKAPAGEPTTQNCPGGKIGTQTRTWNTSTCSWNAWTGTCTTCAAPAGEPTTQACPSGETGTQTRTWNTSSCSWNAWTGTCTPACTDSYSSPLSGGGTDTCDGDISSRFSCSSKPSFKGSCTDSYENGMLNSGDIMVDWDKVTIDKINPSELDSSLIKDLELRSSIKGMKKAGQPVPSFYYARNDTQLTDKYEPIDWKDPCPHGACCCYTCECYERTPGYGLCPGVTCGFSGTDKPAQLKFYHRTVTCCGN